MKEYIPNSPSVSHTFERDAKGSRQPSLSMILQHFRNGPGGDDLLEKEEFLQRKEGSLISIPTKHIMSAGLSSGILQRAPGDIDEAGEQYLNDLTNMGLAMWGGEPEAHVVATMYNFTTRIYRNCTDMSNERNYTLVGRGELIQNRYLYLQGNHYQVVNERGEVIYNPPGDGHCLFYALFYVLRGEEMSVEKRFMYIEGLRKGTANHLRAFHPELVNILGRERRRAGLAGKGTGLTISKDESLIYQIAMLEVYHQYPPANCYVDPEDRYLKKREGDNKIRELTKLVEELLPEKRKGDQKKARALLENSIMEDKEYKKDTKSQFSDVQAMLTKDYWKEQFIAADKSEDESGLAKLLSTSRYWDDKVAGRGRSMDEILKQVGKDLLSALEKSPSTERLKLYRGMEVKEADEIMTWFIQSRILAESYVKTGEENSESFRKKMEDKGVIPIGAHLGDIGQVKEYGGHAILEFTLKPGAHDLLFTKPYMAIGKSGSGTTRLLYEMHKNDPYTLGNENEGTAEGYIGMKSEKKGPFSISLGHNDASKLLFQLMIEDVRRIK